MWQCLRWVVTRSTTLFNLQCNNFFSFPKYSVSCWFVVHDIVFYHFYAFPSSFLRSLLWNDANEWVHSWSCDVILPYMCLTQSQEQETLLLWKEEHNSDHDASCFIEIFLPSAPGQPGIHEDPYRHDRQESAKFGEEKGLFVDNTREFPCFMSHVMIMSFVYLFLSRVNWTPTSN